MAGGHILSQDRRGADALALPRSPRAILALGFVLLTLWLTLAEAVIADETDAGEPVGAAAMGVGLAGIADWSVQQPFIDVMKSARQWIGNRPGQ